MTDKTLGQKRVSRLKTEINPTGEAASQIETFQEKIGQLIDLIESIRQPNFKEQNSYIDRSIASLEESLNSFMVAATV